ncbi:hypothetical protein KJ682_18330 [bacterium]|nr:hypothetical protein [bacterium]
MFPATQQSGLVLESQLGGGSWLQTIGGLLVVFALLILSLKFLGRFNRLRGRTEAEVLNVWNLGPRREIQVLRLQDEVHFIYRHDGAMVPLKQITLAEYRAQTPQTEAASRGRLGAATRNLWRKSALPRTSCPLPGDQPLA